MIYPFKHPYSYSTNIVEGWNSNMIGVYYSKLPYNIPNRPFRKKKSRANKTRMGSDGCEGGTEQQKRKDTPSGVFWSGCCDVTEFIVKTTTYICLKKVRAKCRITSQIRTSQEVSAKSARAVGAEKGERMESVFCFRANSVGGQESKK